MDMKASQLWWNDREPVTQRSGQSEMQPQYSAQWGKSDALDEYVEGKDNLLDHLVPAQQRAEEPTNVVPVSVYPDGDKHLNSMLAACKEAEDSYCSRRAWSPEVLEGFNRAFALVIKVPPAQLEMMEMIVPSSGCMRCFQDLRDALYI